MAKLLLPCANSQFISPTHNQLRLSTPPYLYDVIYGWSLMVGEGTMYESDGDNYLDICLDLADNANIAMEDPVVNLHSNSEAGSVLIHPRDGR